MALLVGGFNHMASLYDFSYGFNHVVSFHDLGCDFSYKASFHDFSHSFNLVLESNSMTLVVWSQNSMASIESIWT